MAFEAIMAFLGIKMKSTSPIFYAIVFTLPSLYAGAQTVPVRDLVEVDGARPNFLRGYGVVVGLKGNGDSPKGETSVMIKNYLAGMEGRPINELASKNAALVAIEAELPPFQKAGTKIDVRVSALGDAKSLKDGTLLMTPLRSPRARADEGGDLVWALAQGRVIVEGGSNGNPTSGVIPNGAILERELKHDFVKYTEETKKRPYIRLFLKKPDITVASQIATDINNFGLDEIFARKTRREMEPARLAIAVDGGSIDVRIPLKDEYEKVVPTLTYPSYDKDPITFMEKILNLTVNLVRPEKAAVIINDTTQVITVTGEVFVKPGYVRIGGNVKINIVSEMKFVELLNSPEIANSITPQQLIDIVKALDQAKLIKGEVISK